MLDHEFNRTGNRTGIITGTNPRQSRGLSSFRLGISLTEVLIAMGILTVGLLGVASIFPVASFYMQQGDIADRGSQIAQSAFNDAVARGTLNPQRWLMMQEGNGPLVGTYTKPFAASMRSQIVAVGASTANALQKQQQINRAFGSIYVIDPLGTDASPLAPGSLTDRRQARFSQTLPFSASLDSYSMRSWWPWNPAGAELLNPQWPVVRVTLPQAPLAAAAPLWPMTTATADKLFRSGDDLAIELPAQADRPSTQRMQLIDINNDQIPETPAARQSRGDYSWIITVAPPNIEARNAMVNESGSVLAEVSVAVFFKRAIDDLTTDPSASERLTNAKIVSTGLSGGELLIEVPTGDTSPDPFNSLKVGRWLIVCGPSPISTSERPDFVARWYRVLAISDDKGDIVTDPTKQRLVSLRGPQWAWQPASALTATGELSNNLCVAIIPGVVAVHSKTIRLEGNSAWSMQ